MGDGDAWLAEQGGPRRQPALQGGILCQADDQVVTGRGSEADVGRHQHLETVGLGPGRAPLIDLDLPAAALGIEVEHLDLRRPVPVAGQTDQGVGPQFDALPRPGVLSRKGPVQARRVSEANQLSARPVYDSINLGQLRRRRLQQPVAGLRSLGGLRGVADHRVEGWLPGQPFRLEIEGAGLLLGGEAGHLEARHRQRLRPQVGAEHPDAPANAGGLQEGRLHDAGQVRHFRTRLPPESGEPAPAGTGEVGTHQLVAGQQDNRGGVTGHKSDSRLTGE